MDLSNWFKGFELGIARLTEEERKRFFAECGKNCVRNGVLPIYEKLYKDANGNMDTFFRKANELPGVSGKVVKEGQIYRLSFHADCTQRGMSAHPCCVNAHVKAYSMHCTACGRNMISV